MANSNPITVADKVTGSSLTAAEFQQILDALKNGTKDINTLGLSADSTLFIVDEATNQVDIIGTLDVTGNIAVSGTVDGHDIDSEMTANNAKISYTDATAVGLNTSYRGVGHLPLTGGVLSGDLRIDKAGQPIFTLDGYTSGASSLLSAIDGHNDHPDKLITRIATYTGATSDDGVLKFMTSVGGATPTTKISIDENGNINFLDNNIKNIRTAGFNGVGAAGSKTANFNVDFDVDQNISVTLTANTMTATLQTPNSDDETHSIYITNGGIATLTWAAQSGSVLWVGGTSPTLTASGLDIVSFKWNGTNWYGVAGLDFS